MNSLTGKSKISRLAGFCLTFSKTGMSGFLVTRFKCLAFLLLGFQLVSLLHLD